MENAQRVILHLVMELHLRNDDNVMEIGFQFCGT